MLEKARDIFQEGMEAVATVHDFSLIYDTLTSFEEKLIQIKLEKRETAEEIEVDESVDAEQFLLLDNISDVNLRYYSLSVRWKNRFWGDSISLNLQVAGMFVQPLESRVLRTRFTSRTCRL